MQVVFGRIWTRCMQRERMRRRSWKKAKYSLKSKFPSKYRFSLVNCCLIYNPEIQYWQKVHDYEITTPSILNVVRSMATQVFLNSTLETGERGNLFLGRFFVKHFLPGLLMLKLKFFHFYEILLFFLFNFIKTFIWT